MVQSSRCRLKKSSTDFVSEYFKLHECDWKRPKLGLPPPIRSTINNGVCFYFFQAEDRGRDVRIGEGWNVGAVDGFRSRAIDVKAISTH